MTTNGLDKRREVFVLLITVLAIAILTNFAAGILFQEVYPRHPTISIFTCGFLLLVLSLGLYLTVVKSATKSITLAEIPLCFSRKLQRFIDLPHCPLSVHARVSFDKLPDEGRKHLTCYDNGEDFWQSELERFIDHVVQEALLTTVFRPDQSGQSKFDHIPYSELPQGVKENRQLKEWINISHEFSLAAPYRPEVTTFGRNNSFLEITTRFGSVDAKWDIAYCNAPSYSEYFVNNPDLEPITDYHDFQVRITLATRSSPWKLLSPKMAAFFEWANTIEAKLTEYDWETSQIDRLFVMLKPNVEDR